MLRGAYMTPEADNVRRAMARTAETAFDRLAKQQVGAERGAVRSTDVIQNRVLIVVLERCGVGPVFFLTRAILRLQSY